jgi:predicted dehydrogenase
VTVRIAVIGCGYWGPNLIRNLAEILDVQLSACCDLDRARLLPIARRYPSVEITDDVHHVLKRPDIDAVAIATPVSTHYPLAKEALLAGKHVFLEKPMVRTVAQAEDLIEIAAKQERVLLVDHVFVYTGAVQKIKQIIDSGDLGRIYYYDSIRVNLGLFQPDVNVIWDLATHDIAIIDYLVQQEARSVSAIGAGHIDRQHENIAFITCYYPDDVIGHVNVNWLAPVKVRRMLIGASKKMIVYDDLEQSDKVKVYDSGVDSVPDPERIHQARVGYRMGDVHIPQIDRTEALRRVCEHFARCILRGEKPITDGAAGLRVLRTLEAAQRSVEARGAEVFL